MLARIYHKLRLPQISVDFDIDAAVSTCLWQKFKLLILLVTIKHSIRV